MNVARTTADRLRRTVAGPMWHGPAIAELLADVSAEEAALRPVGGAHSIWELVLHMTTWATIPLLRLEGTGREDPSETQDWPSAPASASEAAWTRAKDALARAYEKLADRAASLDDEMLARQVATRGHDALAMLHGVIEHGTYHGGQVAILKRAIRDGD